MALKLRRPYGYEEGSLAHSAKGSTWEDHKYVKVIDGVYYYPDGYEGGRHLSDAQKKDTDDGNKSGDKLDSFYKDWEQSLGSIKLDPKSVQELLMFGKDKDGKDYDNFKAALEKAGIDTSKISAEELNAMRYKVVDHYKEEFSKEKENFDAEGNRIEDKKTSEEKESKSKKDENDDDDDDSEDSKKKKDKDEKSGNEEKKKKKEKGGMLAQDYEGGYNGSKPVRKLSHSGYQMPSIGYLYHHGILGMKWGKRNGPPYPLNDSAHSAAEKKAAKKQSTPKAKDLSDEDLKSAVQRKNLEKQYTKLTGQEKTKLEITKDSVDATANAARQTRNMLNDGNQRPQRERMDLSDKTDKELRDAINRENLERQYSDLFGEVKQDKIAQGKAVCSKILDGTAGALTLASLGMSIAIGIKALRG